MIGLKSTNQIRIKSQKGECEYEKFSYARNYGNSNRICWFVRIISLLFYCYISNKKS